MDDPTLLWNTLLTVICLPFLWWIRGVNRQIQDAHNEISKVRELLAREYASKRDVRNSVDDFSKRFDKLEEKLDTLILNANIKTNIR
jgi:septation ring formation regulator EzrA